MLAISPLPSCSTGIGAQQRGVALFIALIVLVAMSLASIALVRSVDTVNIIAGNLAFRQAAIHSADQAVEDAITWLQANNNGLTLNNDFSGDGARAFSASGNASGQNPAAGQTWDQFWVATLSNRPPYCLVADAAGNTPCYVIDRMCALAGGATSGANCSASPSVTAATGNAEEAGEGQPNAPSMVYYRITVRVSGPRNTISYTQAMVAM